MLTHPALKRLFDTAMRQKPITITLLYVLGTAVWIIGAHLLIEQSPQSVSAELEIFQQFFFAFISAGLLFLALHRTFSASTLKLARQGIVEDVSKPYKTRHLALIFLALSLLAPLLGMVYISLSTPRIEQEAQNNLSILSRMNAQQIENWLYEREADLEIAIGRSDITHGAARLQKTTDAQSLETMRKVFSDIRQTYKFDSVALLDSRGEVVLNVGQALQLSAETRTELGAAAARTKSAGVGKIRHSEPFLSGEGRSVMNFIAPLFVAHNGERAFIGYLVTGIDFERHISPLLEHGAPSSQSLETLLVKREGEQVAYLSALRFRAAAPLSQSLPLSRSTAPAVRAVLTGKSGALTGEDYRQIPVLAAYTPVNGTRWHVVSKIDRDEVLTPMWRTLFWIGSIAVVANISIMLSLLMLWRQRENVQKYSLLAQQAKTDQMLHQFFNLPFVGMAIISPETRRFIRFNDQACILTGYPREELLAVSWQDITHPDDFEQAAAEISKIYRGETDSVAFEQRLIHKDGSITFISSDLRCLRKPDGRIEYLIGTAQDITQRKHYELALRIANTKLKENQLELEQQNADLRQAKAALEESRSRYFSLYEFSPAAYLTLSQDGEIQSINATGTALLGHRRDYFPGRNFTSFVARSERQRWQTFLELSATEGLNPTDEFTLTHADGTALYVQAACSLQSSFNEAPVIRMTMSDITPRKHAETALRASIERYEAVTQSANDAIVSTDSEGLIVSWNQSAENLFGYTRAEITGRSLDCLIPHRHLEAYHADRQIMLFGGTPNFVGKTIETRAVRKDGSEFEIDLSPAIWEISEGLFFTSTMRDITLRKKTEQTLRMLSQAVRQSPESIVITNTEGRIEYVNEAFSAHTGYSRHEALGQNPRMLKSGRTPRETYEAMWAALSSGESWKGEFFNQRKDGSVFVELAVVAPIRKPDGVITHYVAVKEDVTEKQQLEKELESYRSHLEELVDERTTQLAEARIQAETANVAKSAFLANMSHEIRTPMNAIVGLVHLLRASEPTPRQLDRIDKIDAAAAHLLVLINDILDLTKIEADKMELEETDFVLNSVVAMVRSMVTDQAREKRLPIRVEMSSTPLWVRGDPTRLRQALLNFTVNAVKFTEEGEITLRVILLEENDEGLLFRFEVEDTGIGIAQDKIPNLFHAFEQADTTTTRKYGGTGLGLAITRNLARLMGGDAGVESTLRKGSLFWFTARLAHGQGIMPNVVIEEPASFENELRQYYAGLRVLVADDVDVNLEVAQLILHGVGLRVDSARNGREAVDKVRTAAYDLILMDIQMPEMNGLDATRAIRQMAVRSDTPILAMTANAFDDDRRHCLEAGMNDFIAKPVDPGKLYTMLLKWLPRKNDLPPTAPPAAHPLRKAAETMPELSTFRKCLNSTPGLDAEEGIARVRGSEEKYAQIIDLFLRKHELDLEQLADTLVSGDMTQAEQIVHALKGSASLIGAKVCAERAAEVLNLIRHKAAQGEIDAAYQAMAPALRQLIDGLRNARRSDETAPTEGHSDPHRCREILSRLHLLLDAGDLSAGTLAHKESRLLQETLGNEATALLSAIQVFDFALALKELKNIDTSARHAS
jgi:two-component system sensor histidine kinase/response regulator